MRVVHHRPDGTRKEYDGVRTMHRVREGLKLWCRTHGVPKIETISGGRADVLRADGTRATSYILSAPPRLPIG